MTARFNELRLAAHHLLSQAAQLPGLGDVQRTQADAGAALAGLDLHHIHGQAGSDDAIAMRSDLEALARKIDPLIAAIGAEAGGEFYNVDQSQFRDVLTNAIHDGAGDELGRIARRAADDAEADAFDARNPGTRRERASA